MTHKQTLFDRIQVAQTCMEQGLYTPQEYKQVLIELLLSDTTIILTTTPNNPEQP